MASTPANDPKSSRRLNSSIASRIVLRDPPSNSAGTHVVKPLPELRQTGRYRVLGEIARGGIGVVLKGHDEDLGRDVAMKVLRDEHAKDPRIVQRFVEEAQIGGQLQHPGIVPVYELGTGEDGDPFFTMKLVKGRTLSALLLDRREPGRDRRRFCAIFEAVCHTIAYAHSRGVIHRDLKPANVMVGAFGEVQVVDWGLAKVLGQGGIADERRAVDANQSIIATVRSSAVGSQSLAGSVFGTPAYMPPEQAQGFVDRIDERGDVFALGAILCEILTGKPPYVGSAGDVLDQASRGDLADARARLAACDADPELVQIAVDCLRVAPEDRPRSAEQLAPRIATWLASAEERARAAELAAANARARNRGLLLAVAGLALVLFAGGGWWSVERSARQRVEAASHTARRELDQVVPLLAAARAAPLGATEPWQRALDAARSAETLARTVQADAEVCERAKALREECERDANAAQASAARERRDAAMVERLQELRGTEQDPGFTTREDFAAAYANYGIDLLALPAADAAGKIAASPIRAELATGIDYWAAIDAPHAPQLHDVVRLADPDPWRTKLRAAQNPTDLRALAATADVATFPVEGFVELIYALAQLDVLDTAVDVAEKVAGVHPDDFSIRMVLADVLARMQPPRIDDALRHATAAVALRPRSWNATRRLALLFAQAGRLPETLASFRRAAAIRPDDALSHLYLAFTLAEARQFDEAERASTRALELRPGWAPALLLQGVARTNLGRAALAVEALRLAVRQFASQTAASPAGDYVKATAALAFALLRNGEVDAATAEAERALGLDAGRRSALAHVVRGVVRVRRGDFDGGRGALNEAVRVDPGQADGWLELGELELADARFDAAVKALREAASRAPERAAAHRALARALQANGDLDGALAEWLTATRLAPDDAAGFAALGAAQRAKGRWREAADAWHHVVELAPPADAARSALAECDRLAALEPRLLGFLKGGATAPDARTALDLAHLSTIRRLPAAAAGFYARAFAADPKLAEDVAAGHRYAAARAAARAAGGHGSDAEELDATARAAAGAQALGWLRDEFVLQGEILATGDDTEVAAARTNLKTWLGEPDFAAVRDEAALAQRPAAERAEWTALWNEIRESVAAATKK